MSSAAVLVHFPPTEAQPTQERKGVLFLTSVIADMQKAGFLGSHKNDNILHVCVIDCSHRSDGPVLAAPLASILFFWVVHWFWAIAIPSGKE